MSTSLTERHAQWRPPHWPSGAHGPIAPPRRPFFFDCWTYYLMLCCKILRSAKLSPCAGSCFSVCAVVSILARSVVGRQGPFFSPFLGGSGKYKSLIAQKKWFRLGKLSNISTSRIISKTVLHPSRRLGLVRSSCPILPFTRVASCRAQKSAPNVVPDVTIA